MISFLIKLVLGIIALGIAGGFARSWQMNQSSNQSEFVKHSAPSPSLDGFYKGTVAAPKNSWRGKEFSAQGQSGINLFEGKATTTSQYPFKTHTGPGVTDPEVTVLKIDYNVPTNPWWVRPILDEVVEVSPGHYLGKLQLRIIPGFPFTMIFFNLDR